MSLPTPSTNPGTPGPDSRTRVSTKTHRATQRRFVSRLLFSTDHRTIGFGYLVLSLIAVILGALLSLIMRLHLAWPNWQLPLHGPILPEEYLALVTMHGTLMLFFVLTVAPQSGFGT